MTDPAKSPDVAGAIGSALLAGVGVAALVFSVDFSDLGAVFPRTIGALMVALGVLYVALVVRGRTRRAPAPTGSNARRAGVAAVMLTWAFTLEPLGFLASSAAAFVLLSGLAAHERWTSRMVLTCGGAGVLVLGGFYVLFKHALLVPLP
jgi:hypothetical protein